MDRTEHKRRKAAFQGIRRELKARQRRKRPKMKIRASFTKSALVRRFRRCKREDTLQIMRESLERKAANPFEIVEVQRASDHRTDEILTGQRLPVRWDTHRYDVIPD